MPCQHRKRKCSIHLNCPVSPRQRTSSSSQISLTSCPSMRSRENISVCSGGTCQIPNKNSREPLPQNEQQNYDLANENKQLDRQSCRGLQTEPTMNTPLTPQRSSHCALPKESNHTHNCPSCSSQSSFHEIPAGSSPEQLPPGFKELVREIAKSIIAEQAKESEGHQSAVSVRTTSAHDNFVDSEPNIPTPKLSLSGLNQTKTFTPRKDCCKTDTGCGSKKGENKEKERDFSFDQTPMSAGNIQSGSDINCNSKACGLEGKKKKKRLKSGGSTTACTSNECPENECQCHFPPEFNHFGCTGNISGSCSCTKKKW